VKVQRALISVSDKTGLEDLVKRLDRMGVEIISTGGTAKTIHSFGIQITEMSSYTGYPEMLDGRVKTLHPRIHGGLLALRENPEHMRQLEENDIPLIDMAVVNLYPFEQTISREGVTLEEAVENIDIGGPSMLRSAAKNYRSVAVVSDPSQYDRITRELEDNGCELSEDTMKALAVEVFAKTSRYDGAIARYLSKETTPADEDGFPERVNVRMQKVKQLRYGENPHQRAAFYRDVSGEVSGIAGAEQIQGKELSFNNIIDLNAALEVVKDFTTPAVGIIKHNNPCGAATADTPERAFLDALDCDRMSAFGSIIGFNRPIDERMAGVILGEATFVECVIAPDYEDGALKHFSGKKNLRVLKVPAFDRACSVEKDLKKIPGGALFQDADMGKLSRADIKVVTEKKPADELMDSLMFGWNIVRFVRSNAIVLSQGTKTVGIGAGQMSRVDSVIIAIRKAGEKAKGAILASDAFFPHPDSIEEAHRAGIAAIIQPGGSIRDEEVIAACDKLGLPMVFTGVRHFRH